MLRRRSRTVLSASEWEGYWRFRAGVYRVIYEIDDRAHRVMIARIGHRRDIYEGR